MNEIFRRHVLAGNMKFIPNIPLREKNGQLLA